MLRMINTNSVLQFPRLVFWTCAFLYQRLATNVLSNVKVVDELDEKN